MSAAGEAWCAGFVPGSVLELLTRKGGREVILRSQKCQLHQHGLTGSTQQQQVCLIFLDEKRRI